MVPTHGERGWEIFQNMLRLSSSEPSKPSETKSVSKGMRIAEAEGKYWQDEFVTYIAVYRVSIHPCTGCSPAELLFGRKFLQKFHNWLHKSGSYTDQEVTDQDKEKKELLKLHADKKRQARYSDIILGDQVLLKRYRVRNLMQPTFQNCILLLNRVEVKWLWNLHKEQCTQETLRS